MHGQEGRSTLHAISAISAQGNPEFPRKFSSAPPEKRSNRARTWKGGLVGPKGRVIAFEPIPTTFALLASNARYFAHDNVTLFNAAISDKTALCGMDIPKFSTGLANYYEAELTPSDQADTSVLSLSLDAFTFPSRIALIKIDAENHEYPVLQGMRILLLRDHPVLIVETGQQLVIDFLSTLCYSMLRLPNSPNILFVQKA